MQEAIVAEMPTLDTKGLEGDEFLKQDGEESVAAEPDGAGGDEESQVGTSHEVIPVDDEEGERAPHEEAPFAVVPPEDSDIEEDEVPLAAQLRKRTVLSNETSADLTLAPVARRRPRAGPARQRRRRKAPSRSRSPRAARRKRAPAARALQPP